AACLPVLASRAIWCWDSSINPIGLCLGMGCTLLVKPRLHHSSHDYFLRRAGVADAAFMHRVEVECIRSRGLESIQRLCLSLPSDPHSVVRCANLSKSNTSW
ncbi:unnamed protein product, partial [Laminaria digitata]